MAISLNDDFDEYSVAKKIGRKDLKLSDCYLQGHIQEKGRAIWELKILKIPLIKLIVPLLKKVVLKKKIIRCKAFQNLVEESLNPLLRYEPKRESHPVSNNRYFQYFAQEMLTPFKPHPLTLYVKSVKMFSSLSNGFHFPKKSLLLSKEFWGELFAYSHISKAPEFYPNDPEFKKEQQVEQRIRSYDISLVNTIHLSKEAAKLYEVTLLNGNFFSHGKPFDSSQLFSDNPFEYSPSAIFTLGLDETLYIGRPEVFKFNHSSCLRGGPCLSAGELKTDQNGNLIEINSHSGHYKPQKEHFLYFLRFLKRNGVDLKPVKLIQTFGEDFTPIFKSADKYLEKRGLLKEDGWRHQSIEVFYFLEGDKISTLHFLIEPFTSISEILSLLKHVLKMISLESENKPDKLILEAQKQFSKEFLIEEFLHNGKELYEKLLYQRLTELRNQRENPQQA